MRLVRPPQAHGRPRQRVVPADGPPARLPELRTAVDPATRPPPASQAGPNPAASTSLPERRQRHTLRCLSRAQCTLVSSLPAPVATEPPAKWSARADAPAPAALAHLPVRPPLRHPPHERQRPPAMVLNRRTDRPRPHQVYIGRPSKWGNPVSLLPPRADGLASPPCTARTSSTGCAPAGCPAPSSPRSTAARRCAGPPRWRPTATCCWRPPPDPRRSPTSAWKPPCGRRSPSSASSGAWSEPEHEQHDSTRPHHQAPVPREEDLALAAATHQYVLDGPTPTKPADRDALLDRLRPHWTHTLHCLTRHTDPARGSDPEWQGPISEGDPVNREKAVILGNSAPSSMHQFATPSHPHGSPQTQRVELRSNRSRPDY